MINFGQIQFYLYSNVSSVTKRIAKELFCINKIFFFPAISKSAIQNLHNFNRNWHNKTILW